MESNKLAEIRNNLAMLPELNNRLEKLNERINEAEQDVKIQLSKLNAESFDVEKLKKDSLSATILKFIGQYEGKLHKEMQEALAAKINYDKAVNKVNELNNDREEISGRIAKLQNDKVQYEEELENREKMIMSNMNGDVSINYRQLETEREHLAKQLVETNEAIRAACKVKNTASDAMEQLESAESWATFDVWTKGGIFSHMAKYEYIDSAQEEFNTLSAQLKELQKELSDVNLFDKLEMTEIDYTTRVIDFWFDNIFTDLNVRDKIRDDMEQLDKLNFQLNNIIRKLENNKSGINNKLNDLENKKKDLLIFNA